MSQIVKYFRVRSGDQYWTFLEDGYFWKSHATCELTVYNKETRRAVFCASPASGWTVFHDEEKVQ